MLAAGTSDLADTVRAAVNRNAANDRRDSGMRDSLEVPQG
jgi:hypothetical protein